MIEQHFLPDREYGQSGTDEHQCKHDEQDIAKPLILGIVSHFGSLKANKRTKRVYDGFAH